MASSWNDREPILEIASAGKRLPRHVIARGRTVLGRHPSCHVVLPDRHVSREQVALEWDGEILQLDELGTKNPVKLNGELCSKAELSEGDSFRFGDTAVTVRSRARIESVCFSDDSVRVVASANDEPPSKVSLDARDTPAIRSTNAQASPGPDRLELMYQLAEELVHDVDDSEYFSRIGSLVFSALPAGRGFIATGDPTSPLDVVYVWHRDAGASDHIEMSQTILDEIQLEQKALLVRDVPANFGREAENSIDELGIVSFMCAPLVAGEDTIGFLYVDQRREEVESPHTSFEESDLRYLSGVARLLALALEERNLRGRIEHENLHLRQILRRRNEIVGRSKPMQEVFDKVARIAKRDSSVLILGETGTGKELIAQAIHDRSERSDGPFVAFNCALSSPQLIESELFGHVQGAFTDASRDHRGKFQLAEHGTVFLDEIGDMPPETQVKLLRVLQERRVWPVGSEKAVSIDIRLIAATHRDLTKLRSEGLFRDDLHYRIAVLSIDLPALRDRGDDVIEIARTLLPDNVVIDSPAEKAMLAYSWPGNVRELQNAIEQACFNANGRRIRLQDLPSEIAKEGRRSRVEIPLSSLSEVEAKHIRKVLKAVGNNKKRAAEILGISRETLYQRLRLYGV